jgi:hypothetical protein
MSSFWTMGGSASSGRYPTAPETLSRTSWAAMSMSRSREKVIVIWEYPCPELEVSTLMPSMVLTCCSMTSVMSDSTTSGDAPGRMVITVTMGTSMDGSRLMGKVW